MEPPFVVDVEVVSVNQRTESSVHGSGGGGFTYKGTGFVAPVNMHTTHARRLEVWVRFPDGLEDRLTFADADMLVREGHNLAILLCGDKIWGIKNFSTGVTTTYIRAHDLVEPLKQPLWRMAVAALLLPVVFLGCVFIVIIISDAFHRSEGFLGVSTVVALVIAVATSRLFVWRVERKTKAKWSLKLAEQQRFISESLAMLDDPEVDPRGMRSASEKPERRKRRTNMGND